VTFHILKNPNIYNKLITRLKEAIPDTTALNVLYFQHLEKLPYLTACIQECLRLSYGVIARHPPVSKNSTLRYKHWAFPPRTPVSMTTVDVHHGETIYPEN
jgi:cytochrome P450